jgi:DNA-binding response OmpR family regulator/tetratricopeptide (TPR) repeat protein
MAKILLAEDDTNLRETLAEALRAEGFEVHTVPNGQAAMDALDKPEEIGLIILDCLLPKVAGFDVAKFVRGRNLETPIVFVSGVFKSQDQQKEAREKYGAKAYLTKPFDNKKLVDTVKPILAAAAQPAQPLPSEGTLLENPVLYLLWRAAKELHTGILEIYGDTQRARVFVFKGRAVLAQHSDPQLNVGVELVREGVIDAEIYKQAVDLAVQRSVGLFDVLKAEGWANDAQAKQAYKALIPKVLEKVVAASGRFRWLATDAYTNIIPAASVPMVEPLLAGLRKATERDLDAHVTPRRPLRLAPGDAWGEVSAKLVEGCGSDSLARAINGRATIAQMLEAASSPAERAARFRQVFLLMSTMAVKASMEVIPMNAPAPQPAAASSTGSTIPPPSAGAASVSSGPTQAGSAVASAGAKPVIDEGGDRNIRFTPEEVAARQKISAKFDEIDGKDYFTVLGLPRGADVAAAKKAYLMLARDFHTDAFPGLNLGSAHKKLDHVFSVIQTAYATLTDEKKRGEYEAKLSFEEQGASTDVVAILQAESEFHKAQRLVERGELGPALGIIDRVVAVMPKNDEVLGYQKYCKWYQTKNPSQAPMVCQQLEEHWKAAPGALVLKEFQGWIWMEAGDLKRAKGAFNKVLELDGKHPGATRGMRQLQRKIGETQKAADSGNALSKFLKR